MSQSNLPSIHRLKQRAKQLKKENQISHAQALNLISKEYGYENWSLLLQVLSEKKQILRTIPEPSNNFVADGDVDMNDEDYQLLDRERTDDLDEETKEQVLLNKKSIIQFGVEYSIFEPTITGLKKSILDATQPVRTHFELENFHFYQAQQQGPDHKIVKDAYLVTDDRFIKSQVSLYRPITKSGDPRMWFRALPQFAEAGDQVAIIIHADAAYLFNLSQISIENSLKSSSSKIAEFFNRYRTNRSLIAEELLENIKNIAATPMKSLRHGDTGIGFTLETLLGIAANSSKEPDYKGIELKTGRRSSTNRTTLFAQVADWSISPCKKSAEILNKYGYDRGDNFKLYCTISTKRENSQGLSFIYNQKLDQLEEWHNKTDLVAIWPGYLLRDRLKEKHAETFWVDAEREVINGEEIFHLKKVIHTKAPIVSQLLPLIESGVITMDHLIKRNGVTGQVTEKGPLFKIKKQDLDLLFPQPVTYPLA